MTLPSPTSSSSSSSSPSPNSCGGACRTFPTPPSKLHTTIIMVIFVLVILMVIATASVLMKKSRRNTKRKRNMKQLFLKQMSALEENNGNDQSREDVVEMEQLHDEDGYLCPIDNNASRDKRHKIKKQDLQSRGNVVEMEQLHDEDGYLCPIDNNASRDKRHRLKKQDLQSRGNVVKMDRSHDEDGYLCPIDNNASRDKRHRLKKQDLQSRGNVVKMDQSHDEDGYLCPIDNNASRDKRHKLKKKNLQDGDAAEQVYMEESEPSMDEQYNSNNFNGLHDSQKKINSSAEKLPISSSGGRSECREYEANITEREPTNSHSQHSYSRNKNRQGEPFYHVLEDPTACDTHNHTTGTRHESILQNPSHVSMETHHGKEDYTDNEARQVIIEKFPQGQRYQNLSFDCQQTPHVYQSLCIVEK